MSGSDPGRLRERVTIEMPVRAEDGAGGASIGWSTLATVRAEVISFKGATLAATEREEAREPYRVVIRYRDDVTAEMRLRWRGRVLDISGRHDPDGHRRWLAIECEVRP
ncbi:phage head closure protein [Parvibaculum sp.]|uniref:phage head closure protein n=1 Tax=Parvibaculum sp. TaxID=2024848 RepID=UPI003210ECEA